MLKLLPAVKKHNKNDNSVLEVVNSSRHDMSAFDVTNMEFCGHRIDDFRGMQHQNDPNMLSVQITERLQATSTYRIDKFQVSGIILKPWGVPAP